MAIREPTIGSLPLQSFLQPPPTGGGFLLTVEIRWLRIMSS